MKRLAFAAVLAAAALTISHAHAQPAAVDLPTGFRLASPAGTVTALGTLPQSITLSHDRKRAFIVEAGNAPPGLRVLDTMSLAPLGFVPLKGAFGPALLDATGDGVWVGTAAEGAIVHIDTTKLVVDRTIDIKPQFWPAGIARSPDGSTLAVSGESFESIAFIDEKAGTVTATVPVGPHPAAVAWSRDGKTVFVAGWGSDAVEAVDVAQRKVATKISVGKHPEALALSSDGSRLYAADTDSDNIAVIDTASLSRIGFAGLGLHANSLLGSSPNSLTLSDDGSRLYVTCGAENALVVLRPTATGAQLVGAIPTGWYPTAVAVDQRANALLIVDGKGEKDSANPGFKPYDPTTRYESDDSQYVARLTIGSLRRQPIPDDTELARGLARVATLARAGQPTAPPTTVVRPKGPIKHVIYVIRENRTYDQVLGDVPGADGDRSLAMFGKSVTPNAHALAARFGLFDRFFTNSQVSADGHNWDVAALANDYVEKTWPAQYAGRRKGFDFFGGADASISGNRYLWDAAAQARLRLRNYGEFLFKFRDNEGPTTPLTGLMAQSDLQFAPFDMTVSDVDRVAEWSKEFKRYEETNSLPELEIVALPNDHTSGTRPGSLTPSAYVAQNDLAFGKLVDAVSHSKDWASTLVISLEDDAQNGPDHVSDQRSVLYVASPYARGGVVHVPYTSTSVVRTIEIILGMQPMTPYDASARPLYEAFASTPDLRPFNALPAQTDLKATNTQAAPGAKTSMQMDFSRPDAADPKQLSAILWAAAHPAQSARPGRR